MAAQIFEIEFNGYWLETEKDNLPASSGIYCVYSCVHNITGRTVSLNKLIYIGESENVQIRIANHEKRPDWGKYIKEGEQLCFAFGPVDSNNRVRCEAVMINKHKPPVNIEYKDAFPFDSTTVHLSGEIELLTPTFTVCRSYS